MKTIFSALILLLPFFGNANNKVTIVAPVNGQAIQADSATPYFADIFIKGTDSADYANWVVSIEASWNGGPWQAIPFAADTFEGYLLNQPVGTGTLLVKATFNAAAPAPASVRYDSVLLVTVDSFQRIAQPTSIMRLSEVESLFPNPSNGNFLVTGYGDFTIIDLEGREVQKGILKGETRIMIPVNGTYFLINGRTTKRMLVQN